MKKALLLQQDLLFTFSVFFFAHLTMRAECSWMKTKFQAKSVIQISLSFAGLRKLKPSKKIFYPISLCLFEIKNRINWNELLYLIENASHMFDKL